MIDIAAQKRIEKVIIAGLFTPRDSAWEAERSMAELGSLVQAAGARVMGSHVQRRPAPDPGLFFGQGKVKELAERVREAEADAVAVDQDLTPAQVRNLERALEAKVLDRTEVILDIFARRARTREARLQVELAQYEYLLPRLTRMWSHLSRTGGGIGTRGPGETQLETDRRTVRARIAALKESLKSVERHRHLVRARRKEMFSIALVGYTNAGKSTLMNSLTKSALPVADQPFMTLDPTTRRVYLGGPTALLSDTVGFVDRLPHHLVAAFHSTLEEVAEADLLLVVVDASAPDIDRRLDVVYATLEQIGAAGVDRIIVLNKIDLVEDRPAGLQARYGADTVALSALTKGGLPDLVSLLSSRVTAARRALPLPQKGAAL